MADTLTITYGTTGQIWRGIESFCPAALSTGGTPEYQAVYAKMVADFGMRQTRIEVIPGGEPTTPGVYDWSNLHGKCDVGIALGNAAVQAATGKPIRVHMVYSGNGVTSGQPHHPATSGFLTNLANFLVASVVEFEAYTGLRVQYLSPCLEPDHQTQQSITTYQQWADCVTLLRAGLDAARLQRVAITGVESFQGSAAVTWLNALETSYATQFGYIRGAYTVHGYGGSGQYATINTFATSRGREWWMTEHLNHDGQSLYDVLANGGSVVQKFGPLTPNFSGGQGNGWLLQHKIANGFPEDDYTNPVENVFTGSLKVITKHVPPGSQRIAVSGTNGRAAMAFQRPDGKLVVVVRQGNSAAFTISNLRPGSYTVYWADVNGTEGSTFQNSTVATYNTGETFSVRWKCGPTPVKGSSPTLNYPSAASVLAVVQN